MKSTFDISSLSASCKCPELGTLITTCRSASRSERPNYDYVRQLLAQLKMRKVSADQNAQADAKSYPL
jgi:hypothetical protein